MRYIFTIVTLIVLFLFPGVEPIKVLALVVCFFALEILFWLEALVAISKERQANEETILMALKEMFSGLNEAGDKLKVDQTDLNQ